MLKATVQTHENMLLGSREQQIEGVVPTVNTLMTQIGTWKSLGIILNAIILLLISLIGLRQELRPPVVIYQTAPQPTVQHKSYNEEPQQQSEQQRPQDATAGPSHY